MEAMNNLQDDKRQALIDAGRDLFLKNTFSNISIRRVAEKAGVNSALISYYFGSKSGLFREVIRTFLEHNLDRLGSVINDFNSDNLEEFFLTFYKSVPTELAQLVLRTLIFERSDMREWLLEGMFSRVVTLSNRAAESTCQNGGKEVDPKLLRTVMQSLLVMPKVLYPVIEELESKKLDTDFYEQLAKINSQMILQYFNEGEEK